MATEDRTFEIADLLADRARDEWTWANPGDVDPLVDDEFDSKVETGKRYLIYPTGYADLGLLTRAEHEWEHRVSVIVVERYTPEGPPPKEWVREQASFVRAEVVTRLADEANPLTTADGLTVVPQTVNVVALYDLTLLREANVFRSEVEIVYRIVE